MPLTLNTPNLDRRGFAKTNLQTIAQRVEHLRELLPQTTSIGELCCGDFEQQAKLYRELPGVRTYRGLDLSAEMVQRNRDRGLDCLQGNALDPIALQHFRALDVVFFGPPLSTDCDGHRLHGFRDVTPKFEDFVDLFLGKLKFTGTLVCIGPRGTTLGDVTELYARVRSANETFGLRLVHHSHSTVTGSGATTERRLKYVELWFSSVLPDAWEVRPPAHLKAR